jgi:hypothetical protein
LDLWLVGWLAGWLAGWLSGWLAAWWVGWLVGWLIGWLAGWLVDWLAAWLSVWLVGWLVGVGAGATASSKKQLYRTQFLNLPFPFVVSGVGLTCSGLLAARDAAPTHPETVQRPSDSGTSVQLSSKSTRV